MDTSTGVMAVRGWRHLPPDGTDRPGSSYWRLELDGVPGDVGVWGLAVLELPSGLRAGFDYQNPADLKVLEVPRSPRSRLDDVEVVDPDDLEVVRSLLGDEVAGQLQRIDQRYPAADGPSPTVAANLSPQPSWPIVGRLALLQAHLNDLARPLDGLWAAEAAALLQGWGSLELIPYANHLAHEAASTVRLLQPDWVDPDRIDDPNAARLLAALLACADVAPSADFGPFLDELRRLFTPDLDAIIGELNSLGVDRDAELALAVAGAQEARTSSVANDPLVLVDHTLQGLVAQATATVEPGWIDVEVRPSKLLADSGLGKRTRTRVTRVVDGGSRLVAMGLAMDPTENGTFITRLPLPPNTTQDSLCVVIGHSMSMVSEQPEDFEQRQARHFARRVLDTRRTTGPSAELLRTARSWLEASGSRGASLVDGATPQPFLAEVLPTTEMIDLPVLLDSDDGSDGGEALAGARSLLWPSAPSLAAQLEARRLTTAIYVDELAPRQMEALLHDALATGEIGVVRELDEAWSRHAAFDGIDDGLASAGGER